MAAVTTTVAAKAKSKIQWRALLRALHRDMGYVVVGLTFIYALSGLAVNHIADWDPNFKSYETTHELGALAGDPEAIAAAARAKLGIKETPREVYAASDDDVEVLFDRRTLHVNPQTGHVIDEGQKPRFLLRVANWLHLNRGKKAWRYIADTYATILLLLSLSGMFMIKGSKGIVGRGAILVGLGIAVPILYVTLAGAP
jgi:hypothetical protein